MISEKCNLVLIRGLAREGRHWGDIVPLLKEKIPNANIFCPDALGTGRYNDKATPLHLPNIVKKMREDFQSDGNKNDGPTYVVSISMGGMLTTNWIDQFPKDFSKGILMNTSLRGHSSLFNRLRPSIYSQLIKIATTKNSYKKEYRIIEMISNRPEIYDKVCKEWEQIHLDKPVSTENAARQITASAIFKPPKNAPPIPILLLASTNDRMVSCQCSKDLHNEWKVPLRLHPTAGHALALDEPEWVVEQIIDWFF